ncbi:RNA methyltransferase [Allomuricauda sp. d1]|uniref:TrmH family RNA methyltransferase n=1 Tax=Allomuricauda sp. d1 TaxID=3136725 RepID=UPI0031D6228D
MFDHDLLTYLESYLTEERKQRFLEVLANRTKFLTVAIEDVYQLHNTSAILRSCDAFGVQEVHVIEERFEKRLDKNIAMGAEQWVDVNRHSTTHDCIGHFQNQGYKIIATTPHNESTLLSDFQLSSKTALFFGTEKEGLTEEILQQADGFLKIPMVGFSESLNVSVSAAVVIQQLTDQLRKSNVPWQLSDIEVFEKRLDWTKKSIKNVEGIIERYRSD